MYLLPISQLPPAHRRGGAILHPTADEYRDTGKSSRPQTLGAFVQFLKLCDFMMFIEAREMHVLWCTKSRNGTTLKVTATYSGYYSGNGVGRTAALCARTCTAVDG